MMRQIVHFDPENGEIKQTSMTNAVPADFDGWRAADIASGPTGSQVDHRLHKVDLDSITYPFDQTPQVRIIDKTPEERRVALMPIEQEVRALRTRALEASDRMMLSDRPNPKRDAWASYREALRAIGDHAPDVAAMIAAWPLNPDGVDEAASLRERVS